MSRKAKVAIAVAVVSLVSYIGFVVCIVAELLPEATRFPLFG